MARTGRQPDPVTTTEIWAPRIGDEAGALLERRQSFKKASVLLVFLAVVGAIVCTDLDFSPGVVISIIAIPLAAVVAAVLGSRADRAARRRAVVHLGLPEDATRSLPLQSPARFDDWIGRR